MFGTSIHRERTRWKTRRKRLRKAHPAGGCVVSILTLLSCALLGVPLTLAIGGVLMILVLALWLTSGGPKAAPPRPPTRQMDPYLSMHFRPEDWAD